MLDANQPPAVFFLSDMTGTVMFELTKTWHYPSRMSSSRDYLMVADIERVLETLRISRIAQAFHYFEEYKKSAQRLQKSSNNIFVLRM